MGLAGSIRKIRQYILDNFPKAKLTVKEYTYFLTDLFMKDNLSTTRQSHRKATFNHRIFPTEEGLVTISFTGQEKKVALITNSVVCTQTATSHTVPSSGIKDRMITTSTKDHLTKSGNFMARVD
jgi:hypothetical protein